MKKRSISRDKSYEIQSKNTIKIDEIENMLIKYINNNECYISENEDILLISNYLFNNKRIQSFIKLNELTINDFTSLISTSKIISSNDTRFIFNEGESQSGYYILIKGSLLVKISKMSMPNHIDLFFKKEILQEYNLEDDTKIVWLNTNNNINTNNSELKNSTDENFTYKFLSEEKMINFSPYSSIFHKKHEERIKMSKKRYSRRFSIDSFDGIKKLNSIINEDIELFIFNLEPNDALFFGGVNVFNNYMRENPEIHLSSAYVYNKNIIKEKDNKENNINNIMLYISEDKIKELNHKINLLNKERTRFLMNKLKPLKKMNSMHLHFFISSIKMIYINSNSQIDLINEKNIFYLVYQGACREKKKKEIIYDEGCFIGLNNIFLNTKNNNSSYITLYSKGVDVVLFKIDLNILSISNREEMKNYLKNIFANQYIARTIYMNQILSYENKKIKQKEKEVEEQIQNYMYANSIYIPNRTGYNIKNKNNKNFHNNEKCLNNIYLNKNKRIYQVIKSSKLLVQNKEFPLKKEKKNTIFSKFENKSTSSSPKTSSSSLPFVISEKSLIINNKNNKNNNNQNPINNISIKTYTSKCPTQRKEAKNNIISKYNNLNNIFNVNIFGYLSSISLSKFDINYTVKGNKKINY